MKHKYELSFWGGACAYFTNTVGKYKQYHATLESAEKEASRVGAILDQDGTRRAHQAIIYDDKSKQI